MCLTPSRCRYLRSLASRAVPQPRRCHPFLMFVALLFMRSTATGACDTLAAAVDAALVHDPGRLEQAAEKVLADAIANNADRWLADGASLYGSWISDSASDSAGLREYEGGLSLPLRLPAERIALAGEAAAALHAAESFAEARHLAVAGRVREAWWDLQERRVRTAMAEHELEHLSELNALVGELVEQGHAAPLDLDLARAELASAQAKAVQALGENTAATRTWHALTGCDAPPGVGPEYRSSGVSEPEATGTFSMSDDPSEADPRLQLADAKVRFARAALHVARAKPGLAPSLGILVRRERGAAAASWIDSIGISLTIPVGRSGARVRALGEAARMLAAAEADNARLQRSLRIDIATSTARQEASLKALNASVERTALAEAALERARRAWSAGAWDTSALLRLEGLAAEARLDEALARVTVGRLTDHLQQSLGVLP